MQKQNTGSIVRIIGPVIDVEFKKEVPAIYNALHITTEDGTRIVLEVEQQLPGGIVRTIALGSTDGLSRGIEVVDTGAPISVPIGEETLGRIFNVVGEVIDEGEAFKVTRTAPIHKATPPLKDVSTKA
jgi:F-type H+/Na+-transporting ATPase subunit beta